MAYKIVLPLRTWKLGLPFSPNGEDIAMRNNFDTIESHCERAFREAE